MISRLCLKNSIFSGSTRKKFIKLFEPENRITFCAQNKWRVKKFSLENFSSTKIYSYYKFNIFSFRIKMVSEGFDENFPNFHAILRHPKSENIKFYMRSIFFLSTSFLVKRFSHYKHSPRYNVMLNLPFKLNDLDMTLATGNF